MRTLAELRLPELARRLVQTCLLLNRGPKLAELGLRRWAHRLGFGGHSLSRSRRYSVTLGSLRAARQAWRKSHAAQPAPEWAERREEAGWRFVGQGWPTARAAGGDGRAGPVDGDGGGAGATTGRATVARLGGLRRRT